MGVCNSANIRVSRAGGTNQPLTALRIPIVIVWVGDDTAERSYAKQREAELARRCEREGGNDKQGGRRPNCMFPLREYQKRNLLPFSVLYYPYLWWSAERKWDAVPFDGQGWCGEYVWKMGNGVFC